MGDIIFAVIVLYLAVGAVFYGRAAAQSKPCTISQALGWPWLLLKGKGESK